MEDWITLNVKANGAVLYNPMNGKSGVAQYRKNAEGLLEVLLPLNIDESYIVQTSNSKSISGNNYPYIKTTGTITAITGEWSLNFTEGGPALPATVKLNTLKAWTEFDDNSYKIFSGTASYNIHFKKPSGNVTQYLLDLGKVYESAQVFINGIKMATLIGPSYIVTIDARDLKIDNLVEIKVSNSMANRIIDLDKRKIFWKKFNNTNFPARLAQNRGANGLFDASKWEPKISGLTGPVTLTAIVK